MVATTELLTSKIDSTIFSQEFNRASAIDHKRSSWLYQNQKIGYIQRFIAQSERTRTPVQAKGSGRSFSSPLVMTLHSQGMDSVQIHDVLLQSTETEPRACYNCADVLYASCWPVRFANE